jgi:hypothetical protein
MSNTGFASQPEPQSQPLPAVILKQQILKHLAVLDRIEHFHDDFVARGDISRRTTIDAIVIADVLTNYYTCLETVFLRISEYFENSLNSTRWHQDLLNKMTLRIEGIRPQVISDEATPNIEELLHFRHFCRYYLEFDYDWDRLDFVLKKFARARPLVRRDLAAFLAFLDQLAESVPEQ